MVADSHLFASPALSPQRLPPQDGQELTEILAFLVGGEEYCLPVMLVQEIRGWSQPTPLPHANTALVGVINLRGTVLPVIDLAMALALPSAEHKQRPVIIVVEDSGRLGGLMVDRVVDIIALPAASLEPPPAIPSQGGVACLAALALHDGRLLRILNPSALLPARRKDTA